MYFRLPSQHFPIDVRVTSAVYQRQLPCSSLFSCVLLRFSSRASVNFGIFPLLKCNKYIMARPPRWQLQSAAERDSSKKKRNFPPGTHQHRLGELSFGGVQGSLQPRWRRQVWSNVFVCLSFKINVSLEDWQNCHTVTLFPYFCFLLEIRCLTWDVYCYFVESGCNETYALLCL